MAWIESHTTLRNHKKLVALCHALQVNRAQAIGHLHMLWWWAIENRENGDLSGLFDKDIALACDWDGDSSVLIEALHATGWLSEYTISDWEDYSWRLLGMRKSNRERQRKFRNTLHNTLQTPLVTGATIPNLTKPKDKNGYLLIFESLWEKYPSKDGKKVALKHFVGSVITDQDCSDIQKALDNYLKSERVSNGYIKNGSTWFNNWRDWVDFKEPIVKKDPYANLPNQNF